MRRPIPSLNWLRVFEAAASTESFARAAEVLNMSTSAVSQQIKALESHLDSELFQRGSRHVALTDAGHAFLPVVRQSLNSVEQTADSLFGKSKTNTLTLQATLILATAWLSPRLPDFTIQHPQIQLYLTGAYHDGDYQRPGSELRILFGPVHRSWAQCDRLFDERVYPVAQHNIADTIYRVEDLLQHRLIQTPTHCVNWNQILQSLEVDNIPTRQFIFTDSTETALAMAAAGVGIALAREPTTNWILRKLDLAPCTIGTGLASSEAYYLVYQNLENLSVAARNFREWLLLQI